MAGVKTFKTALEFGGRLAGSFGASVNAVKRGLASINVAAKNTTRGFGNFLGSIDQRMGRAAATMGRWALAGAGVIAGLVGFQSISGFIQNCTDAFEKSERASTQLNAALRNNPILAKQGADAVKAQSAAIIQTAGRMRDMSGIGATVYKSAFATLAMYHAGALEIAGLSSGMRDYLIATSGANTTTEDAVALAKKLGAAVSTGKLMRFARELGLTTKQAKDFEHLRTAADRIKYLNAALAGHYGGQAAAFLKTEAGQLALANARLGAFRESVGAKFKHIENSWALFTASLLPTLTPAVNGLLDQFERISNGAIAVFKDPRIAAAALDLKQSVEKAFTGFKLSADNSALLDSLGSVDGWVRRITETLKFEVGGFNDVAKSAQDFSRWLQAPPLVMWDQFFAGLVKNLKTVSADIGLLNGQQFDKLCSAIVNITNALGGVVTAAGNAMSALAGLAQGKMSAENTAASIKDAADRAARGGHVGDKPGTFPNTVPPAHASGGIFSGSHFAQIAERGPEAVVPLNRSARSMSILDRAAGAMGAGRATGGTTQNVTVNLAINGTASDSAILALGRRATSIIVEELRRAKDDDYRRSFV